MQAAAAYFIEATTWNPCTGYEGTMRDTWPRSAGEPTAETAAAVLAKMECHGHPVLALKIYGKHNVLLASATR